MANAEMLIPLILLLVLLHLFRSGKKHGPLIQLTFIASLLKIEVKKRENYFAQLPTQVFLGYCHVFLSLKFWGGLRDEPNLQIDSSK